MRNFLLSVVILFLSACTSNPNTVLAVNDPPTTYPPITNPPAMHPSTPTKEVLVDPQQELILNSIRAPFSNGPHAGKFLCEKCHSTEGGMAAKELSWTDESTGQVETISKPTQLCAKCHVRQTTRGTPEEAGQPAHTAFECTGCHDPHSTQASCTQSTCHADIQIIITAQIEMPEYHPTSSDPYAYMCGGSGCHELARQAANAPIYHQPVHQKVPCYVCHDTTGMAVGRADDQTWFTTRQTDDGDDQMAVSHSLGLEVDCGKCHYYANPWGLVEILQDSQE